MYQLSKPRLDLEYDVLMLDEAQDAAPVMADIILQQEGCAKILVGDPHQEIYSFMGAKNAMAAVAAACRRNESSNDTSDDRSDSEGKSRRWRTPS